MLAIGDIEDISDGTKDIRADNTILEYSSEHEETCGGISEVVEVVTETPCCIKSANIVSGENGSDDIIVSSADIVSDIVSGENNIRDVVMKVDGMTLVSLPEGVQGYDPRYVKDISFAIDGGESRQWKQLSSMGDLYDSNPELFQMLFDWTFDSAAMLENNIESCKNIDNNCVKCINFESILENMKNESEKLLQENDALGLEVKKLSSMALDLNHQLRKRDMRIQELGTSDRDKRELARLERIIEISDDRAECLERKLESSLLEIAAVKENIQYYMDENVKLKNAAKVKNDCPIEDRTVVEYVDTIKHHKPVPKPRPASSFRPNVSINSENSELSVSLMGIGTVVDNLSNNIHVHANDNISTTNADVSIVEVSDGSMNRGDTDICEVVTLMGIGTVVNPTSNDDQPMATANESVIDFELSNSFSSVGIEKKVTGKRVCNERTVSTTSQHFHDTMPPTSPRPSGPPTFMPPISSMPPLPSMPPMPSMPHMPPMPPIPSMSTMFSMPPITPMPMSANSIEVSDNKWLLPGMSSDHNSGGILLPPHPPYCQT